ncbi:MAG: hypothetical protein LBO05_13090 [Deltaproteobacteria bacterium]|jgi:hypothetical protein|nr:hypothetical protein [Deltaproteobacteria bacterium]
MGGGKEEKENEKEKEELRSNAGGYQGQIIFGCPGSRLNIMDLDLDLGLGLDLGLV